MKYENKTHSVIMDTSLLSRRKKNQNKLSRNNLFINQTNLFSADLLQQGVPNEWLNRLDNIERTFPAQMKMAKIDELNSNGYIKKNGILCQTIMIL